MTDIVNLGDRLREMVPELVRQHKLGFPVVYWDVSFSWGPLGNGQMGPAYWLLLTTPSPLLGQPPLNHLSMIPLVIHTVPELENVVIAAMEVLREAKAKTLTIPNGDGKQNG